MIRLMKFRKLKKKLKILRLNKKKKLESLANLSPEEAKEILLKEIEEKTVKTY